MNVRFRHVAMSSQHNCATECFAVDNAFCARLAVEHTFHAFLVTFYHFSVHPCADLYYYTTVDVLAARDSMS